MSVKLSGYKAPNTEGSSASLLNPVMKTLSAASGFLR